MSHSFQDLTRDTVTDDRLRYIVVQVAHAAAECITRWR